MGVYIVDLDGLSLKHLWKPGALTSQPPEHNLFGHLSNRKR